MQAAQLAVAKSSKSCSCDQGLCQEGQNLKHLYNLGEIVGASLFRVSGILRNKSSSNRICSIKRAHILSVDKDGAENRSILTGMLLFRTLVRFSSG